MKRYQQFLLHSTAWVMAEILLGLLGLDQLADYSEFLQTRTQLANKQPPIVIVL